MDKIISKTLLASSKHYETVTGTGVDVSAAHDFVAVLRLTAVTGAPTTLDVTLEGSYDGTNYGAFVTAKAFTQLVTTPGAECLRFTFGGKWLRVVGTIVDGTSGSKDYTFSVYLHGKCSDT